jgi:hypothetical protein
MRRLIPVLATVLLLQACPEKNAPAPQTPAATPVVMKTPYQRFVPYSFSGATIYWALDTKTGQLCRTWEWAYKGKVQDPELSLQNRPTCSDLCSLYSD